MYNSGYLAFSSCVLSQIRVDEWTATSSRCERFLNFSMLKNVWYIVNPGERTEILHRLGISDILEPVTHHTSPVSSLFIGYLLFVYKSCNPDAARSTLKSTIETPCYDFNATLPPKCNLYNAIQYNTTLAGLSSSLNPTLRSTHPLYHFTNSHSSDSS